MQAEEFRPIPNMESFEISNHGRVRRRAPGKNNASIGRLYPPYRNGSKIYYTIYSNHKKVHFRLDKLMNQVWPGWYDPDYFTWEWMEDMREQIKEENNPGGDGLERDIELTPRRKCHDCGRPTNNYRCETCWEALRDNADIYTQSEYGYDVEVEDA